MRVLALGSMALLIACGAPEPPPALERPTEPATTEPATTEPATTEPATTEPATTEPATAPATAPATEPTAVPTSIPAGACASDEECGFDDPCMPTACVTSPPEGVACEESMRPPGTCACHRGRCTLRPSAERGEVTSEEACDEGASRCGLDRARGACTPGYRAEEGTGPLRWDGPECFCDGHPPRRCHFRWLEPVTCRTLRDCWVEHDPTPRPVRRPARLRGRTFRPCADGEQAPACTDGLCTLVPYSC